MHKSLSLTGGGKSEREVAGEIFRVALMFGICLIHVMQGLGAEAFVEHPARGWLLNLILPCVNGFAFITGYYGIHFRPSKVVRLYAQAFFCGAVAVLIGSLGNFSSGTLLTVVKQSWFLNAYCLLLLVAPVVNVALDRLPRYQLAGVLAPFFVLTFGWSFLTEMPFVQDLLPTTPGLGSLTGLSLLAVYVVARLCRRFDVGRLFTWRRAIFALIPLFVAAAIGMSNYSSPVSTAIACICFYGFTRVRWPLWVGRVAIVSGPSIFAVYLLHANGIGVEGILLAHQWLASMGCPADVAYWGLAVTLFVGCLILDIPRRVVLWWLAPLWKAPLRLLDTTWSRFFP